MPEKYLRFVNWDCYQHYKTGRGMPPWIKLHNSILESASFNALPEPTQAHVLKLLLLASRKHNAIKCDRSYVRDMIHARTPVNLDALVACGMCEYFTYDHDAIKVLARCKQVASPETETETETETDRQSTVSCPAVAERPKAEASPMTKKPNPDEAIYLAYPRHVKKQDALKAIAKARKAVYERGEQHPGVWLLEKTKAYAEARKRVVEADHTQDQYTNHPATWFNAGGYDDDPSEWEKVFTHGRNQFQSQSQPPEDNRLKAVYGT